VNPLTDRPGDPVELLRSLIRFDTSNPPGRERACLEWIAGVLDAAGIPSSFLARDPERPNLVAQIPGRGEAAPLLLYGHVDVAPVAGQEWSREPFEAELVDGVVWGRGALDMKGGIAILLGAIFDLQARGVQTAGDVIVALMSDEEAGSDLGASFLVEEHAGLFEGVRFAISEVGGFTQEVVGREFYPIQVAEKTPCRLRATIRGPGGHSSAPSGGGAPAKLAKLLRALDRRRLPVHISPIVREMLSAMADSLPAPHRAAIRPLLNPRLTNGVVRILGKQAASLDALLRNTAAAVAIHGGDATNVIPTLITVDVDGRLVPGQTAHDLVAELERLAPGIATWEIVREEPTTPHEPDLTLFPLLVEALRRADPNATPFPLVIPGASDARFFARLGIQTYGFLPMRLPPDITMDLIHSADERVPAEAIDFGVRVLADALARYA
jgi:acetylornithine deacetylase/succinyl-diaminopimelate desuccinylase-like protein